MLPKLGFALYALSCLQQVLFTAAVQPCSLTILEGSPIYVEYGGSLSLNCTNSCEDKQHMDLETSLKKQTIKDDHWISSELSNITIWNTTVICYTVGQDGQILQQNTTIIAYQPPTNVNINLEEETMEVNRSYLITCHILSVAPLRNTRVIFLRGEETLHVATFENRTAIEGINLVVTHNHMAQETDHRLPFSCLVELDLRPQGRLFNESSRKVTVKTFALPEDPIIHMPTNIEKGSEVTVKCQMAGIFPAQEVNLNLALRGEDLNSTVERTADTVTAEVQVIPTSEENIVTCSATLWDKTRTAQKTCYVYTFSQPVLQVADANTAEGNNVMITCSLAEAESPRVRFTVTVGGAPLSCEDDSLFQHRCMLTAQREDHAKEVVCEVQLQLLEQNITKQESALLSITYGPAFSDSDCPSTQTLVEGTSNTIGCRAEGNPAPLIACAKDGKMYSNEKWIFTRADSGTYLCTATNSEGSADRNVTVMVEYQPAVSNIEIIEPKDSITKGKTIKLHCLASGLPPPTYRWLTPKVENITYSSDKSVITIHDAQTHHSGSYTCKVTNIYGSHTQEKNIHVTDPVHTILAAVFGTAAGCGLVTAAVVYYLYYRAQKIRKYKLQQARRTPTGQGLVPNGESSAAP